MLRAHLYKGHVTEGVYAFKDRDVAMVQITVFADFHGYINLRPDALLVGGEVYLWGEVAEHEAGYRAEYAAIKSLDWAGPGAHLPVEEWAAIYGVPCEPLPSIGEKLAGSSIGRTRRS